MKYSLTEKKCTGCGILKQSNEFYKQNKTLMSKCKDCVCEIRKQSKPSPETSRSYYHRNKDTINLNRRLRSNNYLDERIKRVLRNCKQHSNKIELDYDLDYNFAMDLYNAQEGRCKISGEVLTISGDRYLSNLVSLDRIDSSIGYLKSNVQWVCVKYNMMKAHATMEEFLKMCKTVVEYNHEI